MAADQRKKKRLNAASVVCYTSQEQHKVKRKKLVLPQYDSSIRSNIVLEWDDKTKSVVAQREQIGIAQRDLSPFVNVVPNCHNDLADIVIVPREIFELKILKEVLSCEVWQTHLSEKERILLNQFLPEGVEAQKVVQELFAGDNFHFGNPFLKWGASLCSGSLHPDTVLDKEQVLKANKKAYYSELQKYHHDMIGNLQMLKGRWESCKDTDKEIGQKLWRSRKYSGKTVATHANESGLHNSDDNFVATSESCSLASDDDKACSSDDMNFMSLHEDSQRRKGFVEGKYYNSSDGHKVVARLRKGERLRKRNVECGDGAKYMSYIKVSKDQHQRVKSSMKHLSNSIQPRSLNHVLGDLDTFCVQPYKMFEEEERQKLHEHWSQLANIDVAAGFTKWRRKQSEKWQVIQALGQEIVEKLNYLKEDEEKDRPNNMPGDQLDEGASDLEPTISGEDEEKEISDSLLQKKMDNATTIHESSIALEDGKIESPNSISQQQMDNEAENDKPFMEDETECVSAFLQNQHLQQSTLLSGNQVFHAMDLPKIDDLPPNISAPESLSHVDASFCQGNSLSAASDVWTAVNMPSAYFQSTPVNQGYSSANELSVQHSQVVGEHSMRLIDVEPGMRKQDLGTDFLRRQPDDFFSTHTNQTRNEQFQSFFKGQGSLPYHREQKPTGLDFQLPASVMIENDQFVGHLREHLHPSIALDCRQKRLNDLYMQQNIQENTYSDGMRYAIPRQEQYSTLNMQDWDANAVHLSGPPQSHLNGGELLSQNWFPGENCSRGSWSGSEAVVCPNQSIRNGSIADQSLFSVLSQCNELRPGARYDSMGSDERFNQSGNYNGVGGGVPATSNVLLRTVNPLNYLSGHEAADGPKTNNLGLISLPQQSAALHDPMGKPYLRSWNH